MNIGIDYSKGKDETALVIRQGDEIYMYKGKEAEVLIELIQANSPATPVETKKVYIKPLRTIIEVQTAYADQIRDLLNTTPLDAGVREALERCRSIAEDNKLHWARLCDPCNPNDPSKAIYRAKSAACFQVEMDIAALSSQPVVRK